MRTPFIIAAFLVLLGGCAAKDPDLTPIGTGLSVVGLSLVAAAFIRAVGGCLAGRNRKGGDRDAT